MSCGSCSSGACGSGSKHPGCNSNGSCASGGCGKLSVFDWLSGMEQQSLGHERYAEVRFKNTRKEFYEIPDSIEPVAGDIVVVGASAGYDIGTITLTGELVPIQMKLKGSAHKTSGKIKSHATQEELDQWKSFQEREYDCMIKARKLAKELKLEMKISDVEYQADGTKATFYYTSEGRVDFRELIRKFAGTFKCRVEMKQIGTRQEAGRVGGIGSCGRELCCSSWLTDFRSVSTSAARYQQLAINPLKLAGQCGKLKCCLNYELDTYMDALKDFPKGDIKLHTKKGLAFLQKTDIFKRVLWFTYADEPSVFHPVTLERVKEIMDMNQFNEKPEDLTDYNLDLSTPEKEPDYENVVGQDDLRRFDQDNRRRKNNRRKKKPSNNSNAKGNQQPKSKQQNQGNKKNKGGQNNNSGRPKQGGNANKNNPKNKQGGGNKPNNSNKANGSKKPQNKRKNNRPNANKQNQNAEAKNKK
jgi:cell fate regulator YaaT (PSP1 superfamily)